MDTAIHIGASTAATFLEANPTGTLFQGCYVVGRHPAIDNAVLLLAPKSIGWAEDSWKSVQEKFAEIEIDGNKDFRLLDRLESLFTFTLLASHRTTVPEFKEGGSEEFDKVWHWTGETYEFDPDYAWVQNFGDGRTGYLGGENYGFGARAGRILTFSN